MGGRAFLRHGIESVRYTKNRYLRWERKIKKCFEILGIECDTPMYLRDKESFGDLDLIIKHGSYDREELTKQIVAVIGHPKVQFSENNSNCHSFLNADGFQTDLIYASEGEYYSSLSYFAHNDLGNFLGRIAHHQGLKYGHRGLEIVVRGADDKINYKLLLSNDTEKIFEFFGWDYKTFMEGFDKIEDMFDFVIMSNHFKGSAYKYEQLNHKNAVRNKKRVNYSYFMTYIAERGLDNDDYEVDKDAVFRRAIKFFDKQERLDVIVAQYEKDKAFRAKFNGHIVMEITNFSGKRLGSFIKECLAIDDFKEYVLKASKEEVKRFIMSKYLANEN